MTTYPAYNYPTFAQPSTDKTAIWGPVFEKAWAKVKGNYLNAAGGRNEQGIRSLTGVPVFGYKTTTINSTFWSVMYTAYKSNYILGAHTSTGSD